MRPNTALVLALAATASAQQPLEFDTFEECQAVCNPSTNGCRTAAYSAVSKQCFTYSCIHPWIFSPPPGIQFYRPGGSPDFRFCPTEIPLPATTVAESTNADPTTPVSTLEPTPEPTSTPDEPIITATEEYDCDSDGETPTYPAWNTTTPAYPTATEGSGGDSGDCAPGLPGCEGGDGNYSTTTAPFSSEYPSTLSTETSSPETTDTFASVSGAGKVVSGLMPVLGAIMAALL
ncbi:hypothetical protein MKZ38_003738 [Zalerion maritima]|uniref:Uncharacterized protein n=1 Tax=Zalerion maritima TaxID=339359 RepID=A0AAD5RYV8_9PEZI|nr:hypothetical protein MKZ38_003738 [Zalerion maritima]